MHEASNQINSLIRCLECLIIKKIREFRAFFHNVNMIDAVKKMDAIFIKFI